MEFGFLYRLTFPYSKNPRGRCQEIADLAHAWFKTNGVQYGMGALGGSRVIYGSILGPSEYLLNHIRQQFAGWLTTLPMCCSVVLGPTKPGGSLRLMDEDCGVAFEVDNLTEQDRREAHTYHTEMARRAEEHGKRPETN